MAHPLAILPDAPRRVNRKLSPTALKALKRKLARAGISQYRVAVEAGTTDAFVWAVLNGRRGSLRVLAAIERLLDSTQ